MGDILAIVIAIYINFVSPGFLGYGFSIPDFVYKSSRLIAIRQKSLPDTCHLVSNREKLLLKISLVLFYFLFEHLVKTFIRTFEQNDEAAMFKRVNICNTIA